MDDAHIGLVKHMLKEPDVSSERREDMRAMIREVMNSDQKTFIYHLPLPSQVPVYVHYPLEHEEGGALMAAHERYKGIMALPRKPLPEAIKKQIIEEIPGVLPQTMT